MTDKAREETQEQGLTQRQSAVVTVRDTLRKYETKLSEVLPKLVSARRMTEVLMTEIGRTPRLLECSQQSLVGAMIQCGQLGLMPGVVGEAYILPFWNSNKSRFEAQLIPGYRGLLKLAYNSGELASVQCAVVFQGDDFDYSYGFPNGFLRHKPLWREDFESLPDMTHAWAMVHLKGSEIPVWEVLDKAKVMKARSSSPSVRRNQHSAWDTHPDEMWMKTALRHLCKRLPASIDRLQTAAALDERAEGGFAQDLGALAPEVSDEPAVQGPRSLESGEEPASIEFGDPAQATEAEIKQGESQA